MSLIHTQNLANNVKLVVVRDGANAVKPLTLYLIPTTMSQLDANTINAPLDVFLANSANVKQPIKGITHEVIQASSDPLLPSGQKMSAKPQVVCISFPIPSGDAAAENSEQTALQYVLSILQQANPAKSAVKDMLHSIDTGKALADLQAKQPKPASAAAAPADAANAATEPPAVDFRTAGNQAAAGALAAASARMDNGVDDRAAETMTAMQEALAKARRLSAALDAHAAGTGTFGKLAHYASGMLETLSITGSMLDQRIGGEVIHAHMQGIADALGVKNPIAKPGQQL